MLSFAEAWSVPLALAALLLWAFGVLLAEIGDVIRLVHGEVDLIAASVPLAATAAGIAAASLLDLKLSLALPHAAYGPAFGVAVVELAAIRSGMAVPAAWEERGHDGAWNLGWVMASSVAVASSAVGEMLGRPSQTMTVVVIGSLLYPFLFGIVYPAIRGRQPTQGSAPDRLIIVEFGWQAKPSPTEPSRRLHFAASTLRRELRRGWTPYACALRSVRRTVRSGA